MTPRVHSVVWTGRPDRHQRRQERLLGGDCEAFMAGRLAERTARRGDPVAPVLWLNLLAHGSEADLLACAGLARPVRRRGRGSGDLLGWVVARAYLAGILLESARRCCSLADLQTEVLLPFETDLTADRIARSWQPRDLVDAVATALDVHRSWHGHSADR